MAKKKTSRKVRVAFRKNRSHRARLGDITRTFDPHATDTDASLVSSERISGRGDLVRHRTVITEEDGSVAVASGSGGSLDGIVLTGRVIRAAGLKSYVVADDGTRWTCTTRRLLRTMGTEQRHVVVAGDAVTIRANTSGGTAGEGVIERVEPRRGMLSRTSRGRKHVLVANVDQVLIITSGAEPLFKPHLVDRLLVSVEQAGLVPIVVINKIDLIDLTSLVPCVGTWSQLGYRVVMTSVVTGQGIDDLRGVVCDRESVIAGQSGVGKTSLLNTLDSRLSLRTGNITRSRKGTHTTTTAELIPLSFGGYIVDTPGVRQFSLWDIIAAELPGLFRDIRCYEPLCRYPDCTHSHEDECAVKDAVADGHVDVRRYESYLDLREEMSEAVRRN